MARERHDDHAARLLRQASPAERRFIEYVAGDYARRVYETAIGCGLEPREANYVVRIACAGAVKATKQAIAQCQRERAFTRIGE